jgi:hypothetical protein
VALVVGGAIALAGVAVTLAAAGIIMSLDPGTMTNARLRVESNPGVAEPSPNGHPVVSQYEPDGEVVLTSKLCAAPNEVLPRTVPVHLWSATATSDWRLSTASAQPAEEGPCRTWVLRATRTELWPDVERGVVRWAVVTGEGSHVASSTRPIHAWRELGLAVVDGEALVVDARIAVQ